MRLAYATVITALALAGVGCEQQRSQSDFQYECVCRPKSVLAPTASTAAAATTASATATAAPAAAAATTAPTPAPAPAALAAVVPSSDKILIGHVGSMSGNEATFGESIEKGIKLALEEQNKKGGIKGKTIALKTFDDQGKPELAGQAATQLITQDRVAAIIGEFASSRSLAIAPIADANQIPQISPGSTNPKVTKDGDKTRPYVFRVCFIDPFQGTVMAKFTREVLKIYQVAVFRDVANAYSIGLANFFVDKFKTLGGGIVTDQSYKAGDQNFKVQLTAIKNANPEAIYVPGYYGDVALIARQARELGMKQPFLGGDGWDSAKLYEIAKGALDGAYFSNHYSEQDPSPAIQDFVRKYKTVYSSVPDAAAVLGYDAAKVTMAAMERAKDLSGPALRDALEQTRNYPAVSGTITLDADHNAVKPAVVLSIDNNAPYYAATITP